MIELSIVAATLMMVVCVLAKGYTAKALSQVRQEASRLVSEEARVRREVEQAEVLRESAEALHNQTEFDCSKFEQELVELAEESRRVEAQLGSAHQD